MRNQPVISGSVFVLKVMESGEVILIKRGEKESAASAIRLYFSPRESSAEVGHNTRGWILLRQMQRRSRARTVAGHEKARRCFGCALNR